MEPKTWDAYLADVTKARNAKEGRSYLNKKLAKGSALGGVGGAIAGELINAFLRKNMVFDNPFDPTYQAQMAEGLPPSTGEIGGLPLFMALGGSLLGLKSQADKYQWHDNWEDFKPKTNWEDPEKILEIRENYMNYLDSLENVTRTNWDKINKFKLDQLEGEY